MTAERTQNKVGPKPDQWTCIAPAFAERFGVSEKVVRLIGTRQLCLCRSDEARRVLLLWEESGKRYTHLPVGWPRQKRAVRRNKAVNMKPPTSVSTSERIDKMMQIATRRRA
jgi:hypothetical protein